MDLGCEVLCVHRFGGYEFGELLVLHIQPILLLLLLLAVAVASYTDDVFEDFVYFLEGVHF